MNQTPFQLKDLFAKGLLLAEEERGTPSADLPHPVHFPSPFNSRHLIASSAKLKNIQTTYSLRVMVDIEGSLS